MVQAHTLFAFVCPDASTSATQRPQAMRVYSLDLCSLQWALCSPRKEDGHVKLAYPMPRTQAACTHKDGKACHLAANVLTAYLKMMVI